MDFRLVAHRFQLGFCLGSRLASLVAGDGGEFVNIAMVFGFFGNVGLGLCCDLGLGWLRGLFDRFRYLFRSHFDHVFDKLVFVLVEALVVTLDLLAVFLDHESDFVVVFVDQVVEDVVFGILEFNNFIFFAHRGSFHGMPWLFSNALQATS